MFRKILYHIHKYRSGYILAIASISFIIYSLIILFESLATWNSIKSLKDYVRDISTFIPVALMLAGIIIGVFDVMKLFSDAYTEGRKAKIKEAVEEALKTNKSKTKSQVLKLLREKGMNGNINIEVIEQVFDEVIEDNDS